MYESQFELKRRPFGATPDPRCFLAVGPVRAALDEIVVCVEQGQGIAIVSAPAGTGKTLLCERLKAELEDRFQVVILRHASFLTRRALLQTVLAELNHSYRRHEEQELRLELVPAIRALQPAREALVLICDEAHLLTEDLLEELRILSDLAEIGHPLVRLVLVGQPSLEETLAGAPLEALNQRVRAHVSLEPFDRATSREYLDYRVTWAGGRLDEVFTAEAIEAICQASQGVPRCMNQLCDHALLLAYVAEERPVEVDTIHEALRDLRQLPLHWNESLRSEIKPSAEIESAGEVTEPTAPVTYEVVEFGADLPTSPVSNAIVEEFHSVSPVVPAVESLGDVEPAGEWQEGDPGEVDAEEKFDEPALAAVSILRRPLLTMPQAPRCELPTADCLTRESEIVEEVVCDRYAAIDGGFPIPEPAPVAPVAAERNAAPDPDVEPAVRWQVPESSGPRPWELAEPEEFAAELADFSGSVDLDGGFAAVCSRLEELLPEIPGESPWTASEAHSISSDARSEASELAEAGPIATQGALFTVVESTAVDDDANSPEASLNRQICDLIGDLQAAARPVTVELSEPPVRPTDDQEQTSTEPAMTASGGERSARPYRNLFSQLRRKQQGLA